MNEQLLPVLVVGAGPTGLMVANELARHGVAPRIIDRGPAPSTTSRALVVQPRTLEIFDDIGVIDQAVAAGDPASGLTITFATKAVELHSAGQLTGPQNYTAYPEPRTLSQHDTERILTEQLATQGVKVERGRALTDLTQDGQTVTVSLRGEDGSIETVRCRWVIGCDGAHSAVRKAAGIPFAGSTYRDEFIMADAELDWQLPHGGLYGFPSPAGIFAAFLDARREPLPDIRQLSARARRLERRVQRTQSRGVPGDGRRASSLPGQGRKGVLGDSLPCAQPHSAPLPRRTGIPRRRRCPRAQPRGRTRDEHRYSGRLQPGLEARACRTRARRRVVGG